VVLNLRDGLFFGIANYNFDSPIDLSAFGRVIGRHRPDLAKAAHGNHPAPGRGCGLGNIENWLTAAPLSDVPASPFDSASERSRTPED
jgi:hypothetical protein